MSGVSQLPEDCFTYYVALGPQRSYEEVAKRYRVHKRTVARAAERERWQTRLEVIERKAREATDSKLATDLHEMSVRHRKLLLAMASRAATAIQSFPLRTGMEGIKSAELVIKLERLLAGEPTESRTISVESVTRDEMSRYLIEEADAEDWGDVPESELADDAASEGDASDETASLVDNHDDVTSASDGEEDLQT